MYDWGSLTNEWIKSAREVYTYDANGNLIETVMFDWSGINDWVKSNREVYTYNANGNQTETIKYDWDLGTNDWVYKEKKVIFWSATNTSLPDNSIDLNYSVYPNPFTDYTTIKLSDAIQTQRIELIDIHGRTVRTIDNVNSNSVTIHKENLPSGIYFIRIHSDDTYVKKVIIR